MLRMTHLTGFGSSRVKVPTSTLTWSPTERRNANFQLTAGDLECFNDAGGWSAGWALPSGALTPHSGKWYWEITRLPGGTGWAIIGVSQSMPTGGSGGSFGYVVGEAPKSGGVASVAFASRYNAGLTLGAPFSHISMPVGGVMGLALDTDAGTLTTFVNGTPEGVAFTGIDVTVRPAIATVDGSHFRANFGNAPFRHAPPAGCRIIP